MELTNTFEIEAPAEQAWELLMDVPRVVPCMPGAELVEETAADSWKARIKVRLGPMAMVFDADVHRERADAQAHSVRVVTRAREAKGRGQARATIDSSLAGLEGGRTRVDVVTELALSGKIAQFGRGAVQDVASELVARFTENLEHAVERALANGAPAPPAAVGGAPGGEVRALPILLGAVRRGLRRLVARFRGRDHDPTA